MENKTLKLVEFRYFPSLIYQFDIPDSDVLNQHLLASIRSVRESDEQGVSKSNLRELGGWHSKENLHKRSEFALIVNHINAACRLIEDDLSYHRDYTIKIGTMWTIVNARGAVNLSHVHPGCLWSGVYYISAPLNCGKISFSDPRTANVMLKPVYDSQCKPPKKTWTKVSFTPTAGRMLIFPSWLYHSVGPNLADAGEDGGERVIISFNLSQHRARRSD
jgi:uncharacterized protein (TIGR02466 family)